MLPNNNKLVFTKLIEEIQGNSLTRIISKYKGDFRIQSFDTQSHLYSLLYASFRNSKSLREVQTEIKYNQKLSHLINIPSVSQFSRKNASRDYRIFEDIFYNLVHKVKRKFGTAFLLKDLLPLKILDSTVILTALKLAPTIKYDSKRAGMKINTIFNGEYPEKINIAHAKVNDKACLQGLVTDPSCIYLFDRGYISYRWYDSLTQKGIKFITRGSTLASVMEERLLDVDYEKYIYDAEVRMGSVQSKNLTLYNYREIRTFDDKDEEFILITNMMDLSKEDIIALYKKRWEIELFFKWIKQNLKIKKFIGYNENAIKLQIFSALIVYLLIYLQCKLHVNKVKHSMLRLLRILRVNLLELWDEDILKYLVDG